MTGPLPDWLLPDRVRGPAATPVIELGPHRVPVIVRRLAHARRMTLRLAPDGSEVRISIPRWGRTADALAFVDTRRDWLAGQIAAIPRPAPPGNGGHVALQGRVLTIAHDPGLPRRCRIDDDIIRLGGPAETITPRLRRWLQAEALELLQADVADYCARAGHPLPKLAVPKLALSNATRRWGSCATNGTIRINWRLVMAPAGVRRAVVAHEVAHLFHFDHSPRFHALLATLFEGDVNEANQWLRREGRGLYAPFG